MLGVENIKSMKIVKYKKLKDNRYEIELNNAKIILYDDIIVKYNLLYKEDLDKSLLSEITALNDEFSAYYKAVKYINTRLRSKKEIIKYLEKHEYNDDLIEKTINKLKKEGFINHKLYLESFINDQLKFSNNGPFKIKLLLNNLGFNDEEINVYLIKINIKTWRDRLTKIINKRVALNKKDSEKVFKEKTVVFLNNLGYNYELFNELLDKIHFNDETKIKKDIEVLKRKLSSKYDKTKLEFYLRQKLYNKGYSSDIINKYLN